MGKRTVFLCLDEQEMIRAGVLDSVRCIEVEKEMQSYYEPSRNRLVRRFMPFCDRFPWQKSRGRDSSFLYETCTNTIKLILLAFLTMLRWGS